MHDKNIMHENDVVAPLKSPEVLKDIIIMSPNANDSYT